MLHAIPALRVWDLGRSLAFYRDQLGFALAHGEAGFAVLRRDAVEQVLQLPLETKTVFGTLS